MTNFDFNLIGGIDKPFIGYVSSLDKTNISPQVAVRGSKNVYKKITGNWASRFGLKTYGADDSTVAGINSSFDWYNSVGRTYGMNSQKATTAGNDGKLRVLYNEVEYDLLTGLSNTRFVFDSWWDNTAKKDLLIMVNGEDNLKTWSGGIATVASGTSSTIVKSDTSTTWLQDGFDSEAVTTIGSGTSQFDISNTAGNTYRYTWDGVGTDPAITSTTVPVGTYILIGGQNFNTANNGLFVVTGSGTSYFEVTNASGVPETDKTLGSGYIYTKYKKILTINGTAYAYTGGETTSTLTGVTPSAASVVADSVATSAIITHPNKPEDNFEASFLKVINNQVWVGSYNSRVVYVSDDEDYLDYTVPSSPLAGAPEFLLFDDLVNNIAVKNGNAYISAGFNYWYEVMFSNITVGSSLVRQTIINPQQVDNGAVAYAHEFVDSSGGDIVFLSKGQQLITFGLFKDLAEGKYPVLSQSVYNELQEENFSGGHLRSIGDFIYITAPSEGRVWLHQTRSSLNAQGQVTSERLWHAPQIMNVARMSFLDNVVYGWSNANPMIYQIWDTNQWHDDGPSGEPIPYECVLRMSYKNAGIRQGLINFTMAYFEGYIANGVNLNGRIYMDYQGSSGLQDFIINSVSSPAKFFSGNIAPSLGDSSLGDNPLGDGLLPETNDQELLPKFRLIRDISTVNVFEYQIDVYSTDLDCRWEILCLGVNDKLSTQSATFLRT